MRPTAPMAVNQLQLSTSSALHSFQRWQLFNCEQFLLLFNPLQPLLVTVDIPFDPPYGHIPQKPPQSPHTHIFVELNECGWQLTVYKRELSNILHLFTLQWDRFEWGTGFFIFRGGRRIWKISNTCGSCYLAAKWQRHWITVPSA